MAGAGGTFIYLPPTGEGSGSDYWGNAVSSFATLPAFGIVTGEAVLTLDTLTIYVWDGAVWQPVVNGPADVSGPGSSVDGQLVLFDGATGKIIKAGTGTGYVKATAGVASFQAVPIPVADGGTNSTTALSNNRIMKTTGGAVVEASAITASRALASDSNGIPVAVATTATELGYVNGVTSAIQTQLNAKQATITGAATTIVSSDLTVSRAVVSDGSGKVAVSATTSTEIGYVNGVTSAIQPQIDSKQATITGAATTVVSLDLTASRAMVSDGSGKIAIATTTSTEIGYVNGVTSAIQTQINGKEPTITVLPVAKGGTNSSAALNNNRVMQSSGGAVVEAAAITASRALASDSNGIPVASATTATELGYVSGVTSAIQTQINTKVTGPGSATDEALTRYDGTTGKIVQNSAVTLDDNGGMTFTGTVGFLRLPNLTTTQRDALTPAVGMVIMNTTLNRPQCYLATDGWISMIGWGDGNA